MPDFEKVGVPENGLIDFQDSLPRSLALTGTIETINEEIRGTGTKFLTELLYSSGESQPVRDALRYKHLYVKAQDVVRKIKYVVNDEYAVLEEKFPINVPAATALEVPDDLEFKEIGILCNNAGSVVNAQVITQGQVLNWKREAGLEPIAVDGFTNNMQLQTLK